MEALGLFAAEELEAAQSRAPEILDLDPGERRRAAFGRPCSIRSSAARCARAQHQCVKNKTRRAGNWVYTSQNPGG